MVCASTSETGLPMETTLITDVWNDTGILPPIPATGLPINDKVITVREEKLQSTGNKTSASGVTQVGTYRKGS